MRSFKNRLTLPVRNAVIRFDGTWYIFLHNVLYLRQMIIKFMQLILIFQLVGRIGADTVVRLDNHRITSLFDKCQTRLPIRNQMPARSSDPSFFIQGFHLALVFNKRNGFVAHTAGHIEIGAQLRILHQPVFIVGFNPVNPAITKRKKSTGLINLIIIFQT